MIWPLISVIVPTYGREEVLCSTLANVLEQTYPAYEVIVVDQTQQHQPETAAYLQRLTDEQKIRFYRVDWASLPGARNYAIERSHGEILLFIDDDVELPPGYLQAHAQNYLDREDIGAVAGRVFDRMKLAESQSAKQIETLPPAAMDPGIAWYHIDLVHTVKPQQVLTARGCNMSFRRLLFERHGLRFDERFQGSAVREESDFCLRIRATGYKIWYDPAAHLVHLGEETGGCHDISTRSLKYQTTFYHNHFLLGLKNLTPGQLARLSASLFDCHVLGNPPCNKSGSPIKIISRFGFYSLGFLKACGTLLKAQGRDGRLYSRQPMEPVAAATPEVSAS
ncbi:glycosyltransferase family 2 protein [Romeria aff. gracilis LEGE 07310]|uniref:Glycosyltransferase family 2 protein n=1 Tax=Vasconcelosia minhoensis LEGE 07310 TaxID=915328 RepID=A0A8J7DMN8_9CYAN|nr:hormogonium polysaccharide biosynthesis glycosyltransferase HpsN [Romeria gracilis]MBE9079116.1 glycosyltransferase family 2 protein [Romeria aff. gracilis LEGE 07310]